MIPKSSIGGAFLGEFLLGTAAGVAAGASSHVANVCQACGCAWQPGSEGEQALRQQALLSILAEDFDARRLVRECTHCLSEIPLPARACAHCGGTLSADELEAAATAARAWFEQQRTALIPPVSTRGPIVGKCSVCLKPLAESELRLFKNRSFCDFHFSKAIG